MSLKSLKDALTNIIIKLNRSAYINRKLVEEVIRDLQRALIRADVNVKLVFELSKRIRDKALKAEVPPGFSRKDIVIKALYDELVRLLGGERKERTLPPRGKGYVILLVGIQGSGKTTSAAKLAWYYLTHGYSVGLICADTYRPGAYEQLRQLAEKVGAPIYGFKEAKTRDPVKIAIKGVGYYRERGIDVIIIDTAGRHKDEESLMDEMRRLYSAIKPDEVMLVIDAAMGQRAGVLAKAFHENAPVGSIFIAKLDGSAKGGGALAAAASTGASVKFIGTGEKVEDIEEFEPVRFVSRLLGLGDLKTLIERFRQLETFKKTQKLTEKMLSGKLTLLDLYEYFKSIRRLGPLSKIFELIPGFSLSPLRGLDLDAYGEKIDKWIAIMQSMTKEELMNPKIINRSRIARIARGSGTTPKDVRELLKTYEMINKNIKLLLRRGRIFRREFKGLF